MKEGKREKQRKLRNEKERKKKIKKKKKCKGSTKIVLCPLSLSPIPVI
jgi:hypothetical protein